MDFIVENYIWFIIGGIVILMTIIGYIADKTNFTKKDKNKNDVKNTNNTSNVDTYQNNEYDVVNNNMNSEVYQDVYNVEQPMVDLYQDQNVQIEQAFDTNENVIGADEQYITNEVDQISLDNDFSLDLNENVSNEVNQFNENYEVENNVNDQFEIVDNNISDTELNNDITNNEIDNNVDLLNTENTSDAVNTENTFDVPNTENTFDVPNTENNEIEPVNEDLYVGLDGTPNAYKDSNLEIELPSISSLDNELKEETDEDDVWKF